MIDKKRYNFLDVLRLTAFFLVFFYHFLVRNVENGWIAQETAKRIYEHPNFHMATLGVSLFFMISGMGLSISANSNWSIRQYYHKRVTRILIPFYISYAGIFLAMFVMKKGAVFEEGIPVGSIIFTLMGIDGYVQELGIPTFSLGVGEWFLGCLIIMYLIFPVLRILMLKFGKIFIAAATILYIAVVISGMGNMPVHMNFTVKLYEFILGMYLGVYMEKIGRKLFIIALPVMLVFLFLPFSLPMKEGFKITILSLTVLLAAAQMERPCFTGEKSRWLLDKFGKYSFEMYLIHHWVIIVMTQYIGGLFHGMMARIVLFGLELLVTLIGAMLIKRIAHTFQFCYNKFLKI